MPNINDKKYKPINNHAAAEIVDYQIEWDNHVYVPTKIIDTKPMYKTLKHKIVYEMFEYTMELVKPEDVDRVVEALFKDWTDIKKYGY